MARRKQALKQGSSEPIDQELQLHFRALGLTGVEDYLDWCALHGFSRRTNKHWRVLLKERAYVSRAVADDRLARKKTELRRPEKTIEQIFCGQLKEDAITQADLQAVFRAYETVKDCRHSKRYLHDLCLHCGKHSHLLQSETALPELGRQAGNSYLEALTAMARNWQAWLRPIEAWRPRTHNVRRQFASLARHLFAKWPVPSFMDAVWFKGHLPEAQRQQAWFLHLGRGENLRTADLPIPYTRRMAHHFMLAPADLTVEAALRWGQVHALGGGERLTRAIAATRLGTAFEHDAFWTTVIEFLIANPMLDLACVGPIVDFLQHQKFEVQELLVMPGLVERRGPAQPNLSMKDRSPDSLLRQVEDWHRRLARLQQPAGDWKPSGIRNFEYIEGNERGGNLRIWTLTELLSAKALVAEGRALKHCVGSYAGSCARGRSAIYTLEVESHEGRRKVLTVEVNPAARLICQARGKCNALPGDKHRQIMRRWAGQEGLRLADNV